MKKPEEQSLKLKFKSFLEQIKNDSDLTKEEFLKKKVVFEVKDLKAFNKIKNLNLNFTLLDRNEEELKDNTYNKILDLIDPNIVYIDTELNEFYAKTNVTQYYVNKSSKNIELIVKFPQNPKVQFSKFILELNGKKVTSNILEKEKAKEKYSDAIASGNVGIISSIEDKYINVNIGNINPYGVVKLTTEFIQFLTSEDMSYCFETMSNYPVINNKSYNLKDIKGKIILKSHSKITRLITLGIDEKDITKKFNNLFNQCDINFLINPNTNKNELKNEYIKLLFRTELINDLNFISQYDPINNETSCIISMLYCKKDIKIPPKEFPDINKKLNYFDIYQKKIINNDPSLFIFIIDQSGSMRGEPIDLVKETLIIFIKSLPKNSYFQLIGFGDEVRFINKKPIEYTEDNVKKTIEKIKKLKADLGGTNLLLPLKEIYNEENYKNIDLGRNIFILTDGETERGFYCLNIISKNNDKYRVHSFGIGDYYNKKFIEECGIRGKGSYNFVNNISKINEAVIQTLNNSLRSYLYNVKFTLKDQKYEYDFTPINNMCYQDEILNYYFIIKDKINKDEIKVGLQYYIKKNLIEKELIFKNENITKDEDGDLISKIIIGNILNNSNQDNKIEKEKNIELSLKYKVLSEYTSLFAKIENENPNIDKEELKLIEQNYNDESENIEVEILHNSDSDEYIEKIDITEELEDEEPIKIDEKTGNKKCKKKKPKEKGDIIELEENSSSIEEIPKMKKPKKMMARKYKETKVIDVEEESSEDVKDKKTEKRKPKKKKIMNEKNFQMAEEFEEDSESEKIEEISCNKKKKKSRRNEDIEEFEDGVKKRKEIDIFDLKKIILTQNIIDGNWTLNTQTKFLIEKEKIVFNKIEKIIKQKKLGKNEQDIIITILVLHFLLNNKDINRLEYTIIINKGLEYLQNFEIDYNGIQKELELS